MIRYRISIKDTNIEEIVDIDETEGFPDSDMEDEVERFMTENGLPYEVEPHQEKILIECLDDYETET